MRKVHDIQPGKRMGDRVVIKRLPSLDRNSYWLFKCDCGTEGVCTGSALRRSDRCRNCSVYPSRKKEGECSFNGLYLRYKHGAIKRNLEFNLTKEDFRTITKLNCFYCGLGPTAKAKGKTAYGEYIYSGIDRINSKNSYSIDNCVPCCETCNRAKNDSTLEEFKTYIKRLVEFNK